MGSVRAETTLAMELAPVEMLVEVQDVERPEKNPQKNTWQRLQARSTDQIDRNRLIQCEIWPQLLSENLTFILKIIPESLMNLLLLWISVITGTGCVVSNCFF